MQCADDPFVRAIQHALGAFCGEDLDRVGRWALALTGALSGRNELPELGHGAFIARLAQGLDIELETPVHALTYDAHGVRANTARGDLRADAAIVTVTVGVLRAGALFFEPALPEAKRAAIERVGFGRFEKVILTFPKQFWPAKRNTLPTPQPSLVPLMHTQSSSVAPSQSSSTAPGSLDSGPFGMQFSPGGHTPGSTHVNVRVPQAPIEPYSAAHVVCSPTEHSHWLRGKLAHGLPAVPPAPPRAPPNP